jgi:hypothetical protein
MRGAKSNVRSLMSLTRSPFAHPGTFELPLVAGLNSLPFTFFLLPFRQARNLYV